MFVLAVHPAPLFAQSSQALARAGLAEKEPALRVGIDDPVLRAIAVPNVITTLKVVGDNPELPAALAPVPNVTMREILSSAGTYGDFTRYLQELPGVAWVSDLSNDVLVRGGHPTENLFVVDGVEVPNLNHFSLPGSNGGFTSMIDSTAIGGMNMRDDVYDASYSSRLSSLVEIHTRDLGDAHRAGNFIVGIAGAGTLFQRALPRNGSFLLTAHRSVIDLVTNDIGVNGVPTYSNGMAKVELNPGARDSIAVFSLTGADSIQMTPCQVAGATSDEQTQYSGWRTTEALSWRHDYSATITSNLSASYSDNGQTIAQQKQIGYYLDRSGNCRAATLVPSYSENARDGLSSLNYELRVSLHGWLLSAGGDGKLATPDDSVSQPIGQLSPFSASSTSADATTFRRRYSTGQSAAFLEAEGALGSRWMILSGLRAESFAIAGGYALEPRTSVAYAIDSRQNLHVSFNLSSQLPPMMDMISYPINRALQPAEVRQEAAGMRIWQANWGTLDAEVYRKDYRREAVSTQYPQLMLSNMVDTLGQAFVWLPLTSAGTEQARGVELTLRGHAGSRMTGMFTASRAVATYRALDGVRRPDNYDTPMMATAAGNLRLPLKVQMDMRETASSGRLYTPFDLTDSNAQSRGIYDLTRINGLRGPIYNRLDLEMERNFHLRHGVLNLHAGAENIFNRGNLMGYMWLDNCAAGLNCGQGGYEPIEKVDQMGRYPVVSARFEF
jgi:hypothetical protein